MSPSSLLSLMTFAAVVGLNFQFYVASERVAQQLETTSHASQSVDHESLQRKLDELERLRASNAALQAIVSSVNFNTVDRDASDGRVSATLPPLPTASAPIGLPQLPPSLQAFFTDPPVVPVAVGSKDGSEILPGTPAPTKGDQAKQSTKGRLLVTPIRFRDTGSLVYLASDGVVRVVAIGGQVYGVNGRYLGERAGQAEFEIMGKRFALPLIVQQS
jgi:hypothetical protein